MDVMKEKIERMRDGVFSSLRRAQGAQDEFEAEGDWQRVHNQQFVIERLQSKLEVFEELLR